MLRQREQRRRGRLRRRGKFRQPDGVVSNEVGARLRKISGARVIYRGISTGGWLSQPPVETISTGGTNALVVAVGLANRQYKCIFSLFKVFLVYIFRNYLNDSKNYIFKNICPKLVKIFLLCSS